MTVDEFVAKANEHLGDMERIGPVEFAKAISIIERQREALRKIASVGILAPEKDTQRTSRMWEIANEELGQEV